MAAVAVQYSVQLHVRLLDIGLDSSKPELLSSIARCNIKQYCWGCVCHSSLIKSGICIVNIAHGSLL